LAEPRLIAEIDATQRAILDAYPLAAMTLLVSACDATTPGATLASVSDNLLQGPEGAFFAELLRQVMDGPDTDRETGLAELKAAIHKLRARQIKAELSRLADSGLADPATASRMRELMDEQRRLPPSSGT